MTGIDVTLGAGITLQVEGVNIDPRALPKGISPLNINTLPGMGGGFTEGEQEDGEGLFGEWEELSQADFFFTLAGGDGVPSYLDSGEGFSTSNT